MFLMDGVVDYAPEIGPVPFCFQNNIIQPPNAGTQYPYLMKG
jgi:hypothetical protein